MKSLLIFAAVALATPHPPHVHPWVDQHYKTRVLPADGRSCTEWEVVRANNSHAYMPACTAWKDSPGQAAYILNGIDARKNEDCASFEAIEEDEYVTVYCEGTAKQSTRRGEQRHRGHHKNKACNRKKPDCKKCWWIKECSPLHEDRYTMLEPEIVTGNMQMCTRWITSNPDADDVFKPECKDWSQSNESHRYKVEVLRLDRGRCQRWGTDSDGFGLPVMTMTPVCTAI